MSRYLRPCAGKVLVKPKIGSPYDTTLPVAEVAFKELQSQFLVVSVGKGRVVRLKNGKFLRLQPEMRAGDTIVANTWAGKAVEVDGVPHRLMEQSSIMAVVESEPEAVPLGSL